MKRAFGAAACASIGAIGVLLACTGTDPLIALGATDAAAGSDDHAVVDSISDGSDISDGGTSDAAGPRLSCAMQNNPPPRVVASVANDAGLTIDGERFAIVPLDDGLNLATVAIVQTGGGGIAGQLLVTTIPLDVGDPGVNPLEPIDLPGKRIEWVGRTVNGIGALVFGSLTNDAGSSGVGYFVYNFTTSDLLAHPSPRQPSSVSKIALMQSQNYTESQGAQAVPLGVDDYFVLGTNLVPNTSSAKLVTARIRPSGATLVETDTPAAISVPTGIIPQGTSMHAFLATGDPSNLSPSHYSFNQDTAAQDSAPVPLPEMLLVASPRWAFGTSLLFAENLVGSNPTTKYRIGSATSLEGVDPKTLPLATLDGTNFSFFEAVSGQFWTFPSGPPTLLIVAPHADGPGVGFHLIDGDGTVHASQSGTGPDALLRDVVAPAAVVAAGGLAIRPPAPAVSFPISWVVRTPGVEDVAYYSRVLCR